MLTQSKTRRARDSFTPQGVLSRAEFAHAIAVIKKQAADDLGQKMALEDSIQQSRRRQSFLCAVVGILILTVAVVLGGNVALVYSLIEATKETKVKHNETSGGRLSTLVDTRGNVVATASSSHAFSLLDLPSRRESGYHYNNLKKIKLALKNNATGGVEEVGFDVVGYRWYNSTSMDLYLATQRTLHIEDGDMWIAPTADPNLSHEEVCTVGSFEPWLAPLPPQSMPTLGTRSRHTTDLLRAHLCANRFSNDDASRAMRRSGTPSVGGWVSGTVFGMAANGSLRMPPLPWTRFHGGMGKPERNVQKPSTTRSTHGTGTREGQGQRKEIWMRWRWKKKKHTRMRRKTTAKGGATTARGGATTARARATTARARATTERDRVLLEEGK
jgi:hypothetical protein